jgi:hypothetical protein
VLEMGKMRMIDQECGQMRPLYGAMSVCSSTIAWLEEQERERSDWALHAHLSKLCSSIQEFLNCRPKVSAHPLTMPAIQFMVSCLGVVTSITALIHQRVRADLPQSSERFRQPIEFLLDQLEEMIDRLADVAESWSIPLDHELSEKLNLAISEIDPLKTDIPDWREALEHISD